VPLLTRMLTAPLFVDVRAGAVAGLGELLSDRRISADGKVAIAVGASQGDRIVELIRPSLANADVYRVTGGTVDAALELQKQLKSSSYDAVVGIGGGRTLDVTKYAATGIALPMVAVATNLAHDGIASPVSSLLHAGGKGSFGVATPLAVVVDLDFVRDAPPELVRSGIGDTLSNLTAIEDWLLAHRERGEPVDGLAIAFARTAAEAVRHRPDGIESLPFLAVLAESLVLSGLAMAVAGSSRPCSGGDHEIIHAIDQLYPGVGNHGELAGVGALFSTYLREDSGMFEELSATLRRHGLPRGPGDLGLTDEAFARAVELAPSTRPDRYTILEHLDLGTAQILHRVSGYSAALEVS
jgi:glycerol-1-phosphate dehydrogenase [NAD(P)+]